ncbi:MAG: Crp/Fnr family transcriptional regulator [Flavobacteriaceae bacterium]|nr:Crp/Fnr family transcriptional regulator [Flavobacteriaceae bacterium]
MDVASALTNLYGSRFEKELLEEILSVASPKSVVEGEVLIKPGQYIRSMPLLLSGSIKIMRPDEDGEALLLYHLEGGDTCAMTLGCCMGASKSEIIAVAETSAELLMIPVQYMEAWSGNYRSWRNFVFDSYHRRLQEMLESIDSIAFQNMEERLKQYLSDKARLHGNSIVITHKLIAQDLHTSRVVISRLLKKMEKEGHIRLQRNTIEVM